MTSADATSDVTPPRVGAIGIIGRPSVGKSSLVNAMCGEQVAIVSPVPQTTRSRVRGIVHAPHGQLVLLDTPGLHHSTRKMNLVLRERAVGVADEVDALLVVYDVSRAFGEEDGQATQVAGSFAGPLVRALNKCDLCTAVEIEAWLRATPFADDPLTPTVRVSATRRSGIDELIAALLDRSPKGPRLYPADMYTDQTPEFRVAEVIRECAFARTSQEVPHALYVEVVDLEHRQRAKDGALLWVRATIWVERESQVAIVVGSGGQGVGGIREAATRALEQIFGRSVRIELRVKVKKNWRQRDAILQRISAPTG